MNNKILLLLVVLSAFFIGCNNNTKLGSKDVGQPIDSFNNVKVYYNGSFSYI